MRGFEPALPTATAPPGEWVLLTYWLPREPSTPRITVWRRFRQLGVAQLGDGLIGLPCDARTAGVHIERAGCAWQIGRFIDPDAEFDFITDPGGTPSGATPFDTRGADLGHHGPGCSFETILRRSDLTDQVLWKIAEIVHEADLADDPVRRPGGARVERCPSGPVNDRHRPVHPVRCRPGVSTVSPSTTTAACCWAANLPTPDPRWSAR